ncbi:aldo/keto reductase [Mangrovitalea sediminis]|uniref:aldo/keto reductase n=1 Tax=Mangrovitalea sediminis TaxID=1982043 RepID=UPI000BE4E37D|nr:aldo/keto reductase [Mangrovitalea sediminis]
MSIERLNIPQVALGTWAWGDCNETDDAYFGSHFILDDLQAIADNAHSKGFCLWDTATVYGMGRSEERLRDVLKRFSRRDYQLSTKFTPQVAGAGANPVADALEQSLERLGTNYIDLYWIHNPADVALWTPQLIPLLKSGKVKHVGVSNHNLHEIKLADAILSESGFRVDAVQNHFSLVYRQSLDAGILDYCQNHNIPFFAYMVLEQGALSGKYSPERPLPEGTNRAQAYNPLLAELKALTDKLAVIGQQLGVEGPDVAIAWAMAKGATPIIGVTSSSHIDGLARANRIRLSPDHIKELEGLADKANVNTRGWWEKEMTI